MPLRNTLLARLLTAALFVSLPAAAETAATPPAPAAASGNASASASASAEKPVAIVNGVVIPALHASIVGQDRAARGASQDPQNPEAVRDSLVTLEVMAQAAEQQGLDKRPEVRAIIDLQRKEVLVKALQDDFVKTHPVPDERLRAEYDKAKAKVEGTEYHARHILVDDEAQAKKIIAMLGGKKKVKFEDLAKKYSKDSSAEEGGDLGWMTPGSLVPEFAEAMVALGKGQYSKTPVKSRFGWHVIQLEDSRKVDFPEFDKVKGRIATQILQLEFRKYLAELKATAKIELPAQ